MQCKYCNKQLYVAHICSYCKEYYCPEHHEPDRHNCPSHHPTPVAFQSQESAEKIEKTETRVTSIQKKFFVAIFLIVVLDEILRQISYTKYSPYLEPNIYAAIIAQWITPYIGSTIIFLITCTMLLATNRFASKTQNTNSQSSLLKTAIPFGTYMILATIYIPTITQWLILILT